MALTMFDEQKKIQNVKEDVGAKMLRKQKSKKDNGFDLIIN